MAFILPNSNLTNIQNGEIATGGNDSPNNLVKGNDSSGTANRPHAELLDNCAYLNSACNTLQQEILDLSQDVADLGSGTGTASYYSSNEFTYGPLVSNRIALLSTFSYPATLSNNNTGQGIGGGSAILELNVDKVGFFKYAINFDPNYKSENRIIVLEASGADIPKLQCVNISNLLDKDSETSYSVNATGYLGYSVFRVALRLFLKANYSYKMRLIYNDRFTLGNTALEAYKIEIINQAYNLASSFINRQEYLPYNYTDSSSTKIENLEVSNLFLDNLNSNSIGVNLATIQNASILGNVLLPDPNGGNSLISLIGPNGKIQDSLITNTSSSVAASLNAHVNNTNNPHGLTRSSIGVDYQTGTNSSGNYYILPGGLRVMWGTLNNLEIGEHLLENNSPVPKPANSYWGSFNFPQIFNTTNYMVYINETYEFPVNSGPIPVVKTSNLQKVCILNKTQTTCTFFIEDSNIGNQIYDLVWFAVGF